MRYFISSLVFLWMIFLSSIGSEAKVSATKHGVVGKEDDGKLLHRIDFGNAYIMGQTIKSGAVYLLHRKKSDIKTMLKYRENYREEILEDFSIEDMKVED